MAHNLFTSEQAARSMLAALRYLTVLPRTVRMDFSTEFVAGRGQTVNVLGPISAGKAKVYTKANREARDAIEFNELDQTWVPVKLEDQLYNAVRLPDDWATFTLQSLETQVIRPQAESVIDDLATPLITKMTAIKNVQSSEKAENGNVPIPDIAADGSNVLQSIIAARRVLNQRKVPFAGRTLAVGSGIEAVLLGVPQLQKVNEAGDNGALLRQATIGNLFGFTIVADPNLPADFAVAYHRDAFAFVTRPSRVPEGAPMGHTISEAGFALRHIMQYNPNQLEDQSIVDTFYGAETLDAKRAVSFKLAAAGAGA